MLKCLVVDPNAYVRRVISDILKGLPGSELRFASDGAEGVVMLGQAKYDLVLVEIEMPGLGGMAFIESVRQSTSIANPTVPIIGYTSNYSVDLLVRAFKVGASELLAKPLSAGHLLKRIAALTPKAAGATRATPSSSPPPPQPLSPRPAPAYAPTPPPISVSPAARAPVTAPAATPVSAPPVMRPVIKPTNVGKLDVLAVGSSTGGPQALKEIFSLLKGYSVRVPVLITQHMSPVFTPILAEHLSRSSGMPAAEGVDGERVVPGRIYVAPGGKHMLVERTGGDVIVRLSDAPPEHFCKPAVDPMFRSVAEAYGGNVLAVVLTGMGCDGAKGGAIIAKGGGTLIAQDEATSVVWGMPGATAKTGMCNAILPLAEIGSTIRQAITGKL